MAAIVVACLAAVWAGACSRAGVADPSETKVSGITDTEITIGMSLALGGHASYLGTQMLHGARAYLNHVNESGGIHGRTVRLIAYDDQYDPPQCVFNTQRLIIQDRVFALFNYVGTPTTLKVLPLIEEAQIPLVGMFTGAHRLRAPLSKWLINVRASYYQETEAAVTYLVEVLRLKKIAVFYQYDAYGFDGLSGTELALKNYGLVPVAKGTYIRGTLDIEEGLRRIMDSGAEAVVMIGTYDPCATFIRESYIAGFTPIFYNVSFVGADELARLLGDEGEGLIVTQVVPPPELIETHPSFVGAREYLELLGKYYPEDKPNFVSLEGYINAKVLHEGLRRAGRALNREGFIEAIESIRNFDLGIDNPLSFSARDHQGLERVYFTRLERERFVLLDPQPSEKRM
ncbi:MAG: ABC transporter substrate-binding protein [Desulfobacteraceae bacterium]|nr:ABC transporter substrate-binding protein [Desulfobacteraceae bacterium]